MTWILILTIVWDGYNAGGPAISQQAGFQSEAACMTAANAWLKQARAIDGVGGTVTPRALCVPVR